MCARCGRGFGQRHPSTPSFARNGNFNRLKCRSDVSLRRPRFCICATAAGRSEASRARLFLPQARPSKATRAQRYRHSNKQIPYALAQRDREPRQRGRWPRRDIRSTSLRSRPRRTVRTPKEEPLGRRKYTRREAVTDLRNRGSELAPRCPKQQLVPRAPREAALRPR